jgi:O-antigen ligase
MNRPSTLNPQPSTRAAAWAVLASAAALPFHGLALRIGPIGLRPFETGLLLALVLALPALAPCRRAWLRPRPVDRPVVLVVALGLLALGLHPGPGESLRTFRLVIVEPALFYFLASRLLPGRTGALRLAWALIVGGVAASLLGFGQLAAGVGTIEAEGVDRIRGPYPSPNNLGLYLDRIAPLAVALALVATPSPSGRRAGAAGAAAVLLAALALTYSVGAWLATGLALAVVLWVSGRRRLLVGLAGLAAAAAFVVALLRPERVLSPSTSSIRVLLWGSAVRMLSDHPLLGVGLDNFLYLYSPEHAARPYMHPDAWPEPNLSHPHNLLLDWWLSLGLPGALALLWLLWVAARLVGRAWAATGGDPLGRALALGLAAGFGAGLLHGLIDNSFFLPDLAALWWLQLGLLAELAGQGRASRGPRGALLGP